MRKLQLREEAKETAALLTKARIKTKITRLSTLNPLAHDTIAQMVHAWFLKDKTDRVTYGAKAIVLQPYVEDGFSEATLIWFAISQNTL